MIAVSAVIISHLIQIKIVIAITKLSIACVRRDRDVQAQDDEETLHAAHVPPVLSGVAMKLCERPERAEEDTEGQNRLPKRHADHEAACAMRKLPHRTE